MVGYIGDSATGAVPYAGGDVNAYNRLVDAANAASTDDNMLNRGELEKFMETLVPGDISPDQTQRLINIYGNGDVVDERTIIEVMTTDGFLVPVVGEGGVVNWSYQWDNIDGGLIADALCRAIGLEPGTPLTARQFDEASWNLFGDPNGIGPENADFLARTFGTSGTLNRDQIAGIFDRADIRTDGPITEGHIDLTVIADTNRTAFTDNAQAANYIMGFDGNGDGMINQDEFTAAMNSRMADGISLNGDLAAMYMAFYGSNDGGGQRVLDLNGVNAMLADTSLYLAPRGPDGAQGFGINLNITPIERVVRGASLDDNLLNHGELERLFERLGLGDRDTGQMDFLIKVYGGNGVVSVEAILGAMQTDGFLTLNPNIAAPSALNWDAINGTSIARALFIEAGLNPDDPNARMTSAQFNDAVDKLFGDWENQSGDDAAAQVEYYGIGGKLSLTQLAGIYDTGGFHIDGVSGENYVRSVLDENVIAKVATMPVPPVTRAQVEQIQELEQTKFLDSLQAAPEGSKAKVLYNLLRLRAMANLPDFKGTIDITAVNADIQTSLADPEIQALMTTSHEAATVDVLGMSGADAALALENYVKSPEAIRYYMSLPPAERKTFINDKLMEIAAFDPARAKELIKTLPGAIIAEMQNDPLSARSQDASVLAVDTLFQTLVAAKRSTGGQVQAGVEGIEALTALGRKEAATLYSDFLRSGTTDFDAFVAARPAGSVTPEVAGAVSTFHAMAKARGILGAFQGAASVLALILDFTEGRSPDTPQKICNSAADILSLIGQGENFFLLYKAFNVNPRLANAEAGMVEMFARSNGGAAGPVGEGVDGATSSIPGFHPSEAAASTSNPDPAASAEGGELADALRTVDWRNSDDVYAAIQGDPEARAMFAFDENGVPITEEAVIDMNIRSFADRMSTVALESEAAYGSYAPLQQQMETVGTLENPLTDSEVTVFNAPPEPEIVVSAADPLPVTGVVAAEGALAEEAPVTAAIITAVVPEGTSVAASSIFTFGRVFGALGVVGGIAGVLYMPGQAKAAQDAFARGDTAGGRLQIGMMINTGLASTAGIVGGIGAMMGSEALLFTAVFPVAGIFFAVAGIGLFVANQIHVRHQHEKDVDAANALIDGGVGNGKEYRL